MGPEMRCSCLPRIRSAEASGCGRTLQLALLTSVVAAAACGGAATSPSPSLRLVAPADGRAAFVQVSGVHAQQLATLESAHLSFDQWSNVLRVAVGTDAPPMLGHYAIADGAIRFEPSFPLDAGRQYQVRFDPS